MNIQPKTNFTAVKSLQFCTLKSVFLLLPWLRRKRPHKIGTSSGKLWSFTSPNCSVSPCCFSCHPSPEWSRAAAPKTSGKRGIIVAVCAGPVIIQQIKPSHSLNGICHCTQEMAKKNNQW
ncbi:hypothetical protein CHARACLAT_033381 [Characodon lateralis]|uniref:Uncharacterized protein n=1 Tax=Characodon lateralis TaxID=208331 RepID=A0ABU7D2S6_9TELE|nr:hypothetical protein [Characodon lateralis]